MLFEANKPAKPEPGKTLSDAELDKMAKARFEGFKSLADLQAQYYDKFRKDLSARQVGKVMRLEEPFGPKHCCGKHEGPKFDGKKCDKQHGPKHFEGPKPMPQFEPKAE